VVRHIRELRQRGQEQGEGSKERARTPERGKDASKEKEEVRGCQSNIKKDQRHNKRGGHGNGHSYLTIDWDVTKGPGGGKQGSS